MSRIWYILCKFCLEFIYRHSFESGQTFLCFIIVHLTLHKLISFVPMNEINFHSPSHKTLVSQVLFNKDSSAPSTHLGQFESASHLKQYSSTFKVLRKELDHSGDCAICSFFSVYVLHFFSLPPDCHKQWGFFLTASEEFMQ